MAGEDESNQVAELQEQLRQLKLKNAQLKDKHPRRPNWRRITWLTLLSLGLLSLIPASLMLWLHRTVTTSDGYLRAVGPAIHEPAVQQAIQKGASDAIFQRVDLNQMVSQALPDNAQFLTEPVAGQVKTYTNSTIGTIVASPRFADLWVNVNRRAQQRFMKIATTSSGDPTVSVDDLYQTISTQLADTRLAPLANRQLPAGVGTITVATIPALERIPHLVTALDSWTWGLLLLTLVLLAASIWAAPNRRRAVVWTGLGWIVAAVIALVLVRLTRNMALAHVADPTYRAGAAAFWQTLLNPFLIEILVLMLIGLATLTVGWLLGPGRAAVRLRRTSQLYLADGRAAIWPHAAQNTFIRGLQRYHVALRWLILAVIVVALVMSAPLTITQTLVILALAGLAYLLLEFLAVPEVAARL
jgi:hypothetical protein